MLHTASLDVEWEKSSPHATCGAECHAFLWRNPKCFVLNRCHCFWLDKMENASTLWFVWAPLWHLQSICSVKHNKQWRVRSVIQARDFRCIFLNLLLKSDREIWLSCLLCVVFNFSQITLCCKRLRWTHSHCTQLYPSIKSPRPLRELTEDLWLENIFQMNSSLACHNAFPLPLVVVRDCGDPRRGLARTTEHPGTSAGCVVVSAVNSECVVETARGRQRLSRQPLARALCSFTRLGRASDTFWSGVCAVPPFRR